jgi:hypothetical protein
MENLDQKHRLMYQYPDVFNRLLIPLEIAENKLDKLEPD